MFVSVNLKYSAGCCSSGDNNVSFVLYLCGGCSSRTQAGFCCGKRFAAHFKGERKESAADGRPPADTFPGTENPSQARKSKRKREDVLEKEPSAQRCE